MTKSYHLSREKRGRNLILDLFGYYDIKEVITDIARGEVDLDTLKAGASLIPAGKVIKLPKVIKAIGNVGKTGFKKGKEGEKIAKSGQTKQIKARDKGGSGRKPKTRSYEDEKYRVGPYNDIKGAKGFDAHHVGQKALMKKFIKGYNPKTAPAINVPKFGHTIKKKSRSSIKKPKRCRWSKTITSERYL